MNKTYVKVHGQWVYLYRAVDKHGNTIDLYLSPTRNTAAAKRFLGKALHGLEDWEKPTVINTDKAPTYAAAPADLKKANAHRRLFTGKQVPEQRDRGRPALDEGGRARPWHARLPASQL